MVKQIKFTTTVYENGHPKFTPGEVRLYTPDMERWVRRGAAVVIEVKEPEPKPEPKPEPERTVRRGRQHDADDV